MPYGFCEECGEQDALYLDGMTGRYLCEYCFDGDEREESEEDDE